MVTYKRMVMTFSEFVQHSNERMTYNERVKAFDEYCLAKKRELEAKPWLGICCKACWTAKGKKCRCKCGGSNHQHGLTKQLDDDEDNAPPSLEIQKRQIEAVHGNEDAVPPTLVWWEGTVPNKCPTCGQQLGPLRHYDHHAGWPVMGFESKQWLYRRCFNPNCHDGRVRYAWAAWKLGVSRNEGMPL